MIEHSQLVCAAWRRSGKAAVLALVTIWLFAFVGCGGGSSDPPATQITNSTVAATDNVLVAQYSVTTNGQATVRIEFGPTAYYGFQTSPLSTSTGGGTVTFLVAGMKQNSEYHMRAVVNSVGQVFDTDHTFHTGSIPAGIIPSFHVTIPRGQQPTSGVRLVSGAGQEFALNNAGDVIWYYPYQTSRDSPFLTKLLPNGHMLILIPLVNPTSSTLREVDLAGNTIRELTLDQLSQKLQAAGYNIQLASIDHDVLVLPNGHWLFIVTDGRFFTDLPGYPGTIFVDGNAVIDVDQNNNVTWVWDAFDHLDVNRHPMLFPDWTHANSLFYIPNDGSFLISLRHQHWVLKIDYKNGTGSGDVIWRLGYQGDFTLENSSSPADWFYAQHDANIVSPNLTGHFQLALFDNGNNRVLDDGGTTCSPIGTPCYSTAAIFDVDESTMTASRKWSDQTAYSFWGGSNQLLSNSNVLFNETAPSDLQNGSRAVEVLQQPNPTVVWQLEVQGMSMYRTKLIPSLYPGILW